MFAGAQDDLLAAGMSYMRGDGAGAVGDIFGIARNPDTPGRSVHPSEQDRSGRRGLVEWVQGRADRTSTPFTGEERHWLSGE